MPVRLHMRMKNECISFEEAALPERSLRRRLLDGVFWLTAVKVLSQLISWTITVYVIRILSPNDYGLLAMAGVYLSFIILLKWGSAPPSFRRRISVLQRASRCRLDPRGIHRIHYPQLGFGLQ